MDDRRFALSRASRLAALTMVLTSLLSACSDKVTLTNATIAEVSGASASLPLPEPGGWRTDTRLLRFDAGRTPSPAAKAVADHVGDIVTTESCLGTDDAKKPLFADLSPAAGSNCRFPHFRYTGGVLDAAMVCRNAAGETLSVTQKGRYSATAVDLVSAVTRTAADGRPDGGQQTRITARHTGECPDNDPPPAR